MTDPALAGARLAKRVVLDMIRHHPQLRGVGITRLEDGSYAVKVNLTESVDLKIPDDVDGVPIVINVVGSINAV